MIKIFSFFVLCIALVGCSTTTYEFTSIAADQSITSPKEDQAQIVFLRPTKGVMGVFNSIIFDISNGADEIIGVAPANSRFAHDFAPGSHRLFSTNGLQGHIMDMTVEAGQRYYVVVRPIYGNGFQLRPLKPNADGEFKLDMKQVEDWIGKTQVTQKMPGTDQWYTDFKTNIDKVKADALEVWDEKDSEQRNLLTLEPSDAAPR